MLESVRNWLTQGELITLLLCVAAILFWLILWLVPRKRVHGDAERQGVRRGRGLLVALGVLLPTVIVAYWLLGGVEALSALRERLVARGVYESILWTIGAAVVVFILAYVIERALLRGAGDMEARHKVRRGVAWGRTAVFLVILVFIWSKVTQDVGVFLGILGAGVALSLQETLLCIAGWALVVVKKPFDVGDRVEISNHIGDVIDVAVFHTTLLEVGKWVEADQSTGRIVHVPNSMFFRFVCFNYTKGFPFIWNELKTVVTFESDWKKAKQIILKQAEAEADKIAAEVRRQIKEMQGRYAIRYERLTPIVYTSIAEHGIAITLRYLSPVRERRLTSHLICEGILEGFAREQDIDFAYPTTRFYTGPGDAPRPHGPQGAPWGDH